MVLQVQPSNGRARWWLLLLPCAYLFHLAEEWWGGPGLAHWTATTLGREVSATRFLILNGICWPLFAALTVAAIRRSSFSWFPTTFASIVLINAALHILGSLTTRSYSPGLLTGLALYIPIGSCVLYSAWRELRQPRFALALLGGVLIHALVAGIAFA